MKEIVHKVSDNLKLSISEERDDKFKLVYRHGERFIYMDESEGETVKELIEETL